MYNKQIFFLLLLLCWTIIIHAQEGLPLGWHARDIGSQSVPGTTEYDSDAEIFTLTSTGDQIFRPDNLHFAYTIQTGNFEIITLVSFITGMGTDGYETDPFEEAGVMVREDLGPFSKTYYLSVRGDNGIRYYVRNEDELDKMNHPGEGARNMEVPTWLKIKRIGNSFDSYFSQDGKNWIYSEDANENIPMNSTCYAGLWCRGNANFVEIWGWDHPNPGEIYPMLAEFEGTQITEIANIYTVQNPVTAHFVNINEEDNVLPIGNVFGKLETDIIDYSVSSSDLRTCRATVGDDTLEFNPRDLGSCTMTLEGEVASYNLVNKFPVFVWETPEGWESKDLGQVKTRGYVLKKNRLLTMGGSADAAAVDLEEGSHYLFKSLKGNLELSAKIVSADVATQGSLTGLAIMDSAAENSSSMARIVYGGDGMIRFESRANQGDTVIIEAQSGISMPAWIKLSMNNNNISAYTSNDNITWTQLGPVANPNLDEFYTAGIIAGSNDNPNLSQCIFEDILILNNIPGLNNPVGDKNLTVGENLELNISDVFGYSGGTPEIVLENGTPDVVDAEIINDSILSINALKSGESTLTLKATIDTFEFENVFTVFSTDPIPEEWIFEDIGPVINSGFAVNDGNNAYSISTFGSSISGTEDNFSFLYKNKEGPQRITAYITKIEDRGAGSQAGIMFRESSEPGSLYMMYTLTAYDGIKLQYRWDDDSYTEIEESDATIEPPCWLRLSRNEYNYFQAYYSEDGENWTPHGQFRIPLDLPSTSKVGLVATSGLAIGSSSFENVTFEDPTGTDDNIEEKNLRVTSYPNPFSNQTTIEVNLDKPMDVTVNIYNVAGAKLLEVYNDRMYPGGYKIILDGRGLEPGVYFYKVVTPEATVSKRILLIR